MSDELKPCPFCGGEAKAFYCEESGTFDVQCQQCGAIPFIGSRTSERKTMADVIAAWNARAVVTDEQFSLAVHDGRAWQAVRECKLEECEWGNGQCTWGCRCTACGDKFEHTSGITWNFCPNCGAKVVG